MRRLLTWWAIGYALSLIAPLVLSYWPQWEQSAEVNLTILGFGHACVLVPSLRIACMRWHSCAVYAVLSGLFAFWGMLIGMVAWVATSLVLAPLDLGADAAGIDGTRERSCIAGAITFGIVSIAWSFALVPAFYLSPVALRGFVVHHLAWASLSLCFWLIPLELDHTFLTWHVVIGPVLLWMALSLRATGDRVPPGVSQTSP